MNLEFTLTFEDNETETIVCQDTNDLVMLTEKLTRLTSYGEQWIPVIKVKDLEEIQ